MLSPPGGPTLEEPDMVMSEAVSSVAVEERPSLAGEKHDLAPPVRAMEPSCLEPQQGASAALSESEQYNFRG